MTARVRPLYHADAFLIPEQAGRSCCDLQGPNVVFDALRFGLTAHVFLSNRPFQKGWHV